ncbi:MAG: hypothetical protein L0G27_05385 [Paracoccus sp. (in: a-proteobacteria)]|nr:hypothetical protein [Paracoccus sp. (in: a-proteobacteria)]
MQDDMPSAKNAASEPPEEQAGADMMGRCLAGFAPLWKPRHFSEHTHEMVALPLLFWLVDELKPELTVQIGLGHGTCFMGLCQAIDKIGTGGRILGHPLGKEQLSTDQSWQCTSLYDRIAWVCKPDDQPENLTKVAPQLLVLSDPIDEALLSSWLGRLAENAVILLRRSAKSESDAQITALCTRLDRSVRRITFPREMQEIVILLVGDALPCRILQLAGDSPDARSTRALFQRLADGLQQEVLAQKQLAALEVANASLNHARTEVENLRQEANAAGRSEAAELSKVATLQDTAFDVEQDDGRLQEARKALQLTEARLVDREQSLTRHENALADFAIQLDELTNERADREAALGQYQSEVLVLTRQAEFSYHTAEQATTELEKAREALRQAEVELIKSGQSSESLKILLSESRAENNALRASTSWKITAPVRKLKNGLKRLQLSR